jgi:hypothetical protein
MDIKSQLRRLVDQLEGDAAEEALEYLRWVINNRKHLSDADLARIVDADRNLSSPGPVITKILWRADDEPSH